MDYKDYYKTLGVARDASQDDIKRAYRKLARANHPDVDGSEAATQRFKEAGEAYEVLKDPEKRAAYDELGQNWQAGQNFRPPPDWNPQDFGFAGGGFTDATPEDHSAFFEELFGRRGRGPGMGAGFRSGDGFEAQRPGAGFEAAGADQHATITIDLRDAFTGAKRLLSLQMPEMGPEGRLHMAERKLSVTIPKGIAEGQTIRLKGQGGPGLGAGAAGDLYLDVQFAPDPLYRVDGRDLTVDLPITPWEAALGASVKLPTPGGPVEAKVPKGARPGQKLRLKGRGLPSRTPGDLYAILKLVNPPVKTDAERAAFEALRAAFDFDPRAGMGG